MNKIGWYILGVCVIVAVLWYMISDGFTLNSVWLVIGILFGLVGKCLKR